MESIVIQGKQVPFERGSIPLAQGELDPKNPRIQYLVGLQGGSVTQEQLDRMIWAKDKVKLLAQGIRQNGATFDPIIVQRKRNANGQVVYVVKEGNCRFVVYTHLSAQFPNGPWDTIPAMIFDVDLTEEDLAVLLASLHVAGKIRHDAFEQAKQIFDLHNQYGKPYDWLSNHLMMGKSKIKQQLAAYEATQMFLAANPDPANLRKFSMFEEVMKKKELRERFENEAEFRRTFHQWLVQERLTDAKQVRDLPAILGHPEAAKTLDTQGYEEARKALVRDDPSLSSGLYWSIKDATEKIQSAGLSEMAELGGNMSPQKIILIRNLHRAIQDLATMTKIQL
jgi:hypothetical protein